MIKDGVIYEPFKLFSGVYVAIEDKNSNFLLLRRSNTRWASGLFSFVSGFIDGDESVIEAAIREIKEEIGITVKTKDMVIFHIMHRKSGDAEFIDFFILVKNWFGEPRNIEQDKCSEIKWFPASRLPKDIVPHIKLALDRYNNGNFFSEDGFE